jgi:hypothetical protein
MHRNEEEQRKWIRQAVINDARQLIGKREQLKGISDTARAVWTALVEADTWQVAVGPKPNENWKEPEEIWSVKPNVTHRSAGDES